MSNEERKQIVSEGLERRKADRAAAEQEARLDRYERDQLDAVHLNCTGARLSRAAEEERMQRHQERVARRQEWAAQAARAQLLEDKSMAAVRYYGAACLFILWLCAVTRFPVWAAFALIAGLAVFPMVYIFRLYNPMED